MRRRVARMVWLVAGGVVLGLLAIAATSYVMRLDQDAEVGSVPISGPVERLPRMAATSAGGWPS